jgi:hypothetical protein
MAAISSLLLISDQARETPLKGVAAVVVSIVFLL